jgi:methionyl-tRNA formyltransferase
MLAAHHAAARLAGLLACRAPCPAMHSSQITSVVSLSRCSLAAPRQPAQRPAATRAGRAACAAAADPAAAPPPPGKKRLVFLGTPDVAALVLEKLLAAARLPHASFEVAAVVSQPGRPRGRKRVAQPSPVEQLALDAGLPAAAILCPERANDPAFLDALRALAPDLCLTAAYGNYLPPAFLRIPARGTLNIHPSLLPAYRGAAPVQRSLEDGAAATGVSLLYTVREMDAGPVLAQRRVEVDPDVQAPALLRELFSLGTELLLERLDSVWAGAAGEGAAPQDAAAATHAPKLAREEGRLDFARPAAACHNKVRGFAGWPGTYHTFELCGGADAGVEEVELKVLQTRVGGGGGGGGADNVVEFAGDALRVLCGDGRTLEILEVQAPGRRPVAARDFANGLKGRALRWRSAP